MTAAEIPVEEKQRLSELYRYEILDTPHEEEFNDIVLLASQICRTPAAKICFIDRSRQWVKAAVGTDNISLDRDNSFCSHTILNNDLFEVRNALEDERFFDNPLVKQSTKICFYAGMPLITSKGYKLGALCVIDIIPRKLTEEQRFALKVLSAQTVKLMELKVLNKEATHTAEVQQRIISVMSHDIRSPLTSIKSFLDLNKKLDFTEEEKDEMFVTLSNNISRTLQLLNNLVEWSRIQLQFKKRRELLKLKNVVQECVDQAELSILLKQNQVFNLVEPDILINADKEAIQFILRNLISNANKFTETGIIKISFFKKNGGCYINVTDTGVGIETSKIKQILDDSGLFHTNGTRNERGTGLGLSLVKSYLNKTGHDIEINSTLKKGTCIQFSICSAKELVPILA